MSPQGLSPRPGAAVLRHVVIGGTEAKTNRETMVYSEGHTLQVTKAPEATMQALGWKVARPTSAPRGSLDVRLGHFGSGLWPTLLAPLTPIWQCARSAMTRVVPGTHLF